MAMDEFRSSTPSSAPAGDTYSGAPKRTSHRKLIMWLVVLLLILLGALWLADKAPSVVDVGDDTTSTEIAPGTTLTEAPEGSVIAGFPEGLILEEGVATDESYAISYADNNTSQPVVSYRSKQTLEENIAAYGAYLALNDWTVTNEADAESDPVFFYAAKEGATLNITFASGEEGVLVNIQYVTSGE